MEPQSGPNRHFSAQRSNIAHFPLSLGVSIRIADRSHAMEQQSSQLRTLRGIQQSFVKFSPDAPLSPREPQGAVYTKRWVVDLLLDLAGYVPDINLVDVVAVEPAAGEGAFLEAIIERLVASCCRLGREIGDCAPSLVAFEVDINSAGAARETAFRTLVSLGVAIETARNLADSWIRTGDYLLDSFSSEADFVLGNPPYVRLEEMSESTAGLYRQLYSTMRGRADLYVAFFEAALSQLRDGGTCAFICADRWMRNQYGTELRRFITSRFSVDTVLEMHNAAAFQDDVDAYPAITVIRRQSQGATVVARAGVEAEYISREQLAATLKGDTAKDAKQPPGVRAALVQTWFTEGDPWPCSSPEQLALLRRIEEQFPPLELNAKVGIGVATGKDSVFITKDPNLIEPSRLLKLALAKDIRDGNLEWSGHYLVNPWNGAGLVSLDAYPQLQVYLERHSASLKKRHTALKSTKAWYKTIDRVSHSLTDKPKLYIADIKNRLDPVIDPGGTYPHHNLYYIESEDWDLEVLGGILMSTVGQFFVESYGVKMRGGYMRFQAQYLRRIRLPRFDSITPRNRGSLADAFRTRDRSLATRVAYELYGIEAAEMEEALGHR
jgi:adenine-specific DNA-methyltransferase